MRELSLFEQLPHDLIHVIAAKVVDPPLQIQGRALREWRMRRGYDYDYESDEDDDFGSRWTLLDVAQAAASIAIAGGSKRHVTTWPLSQEIWRLLRAKLPLPGAGRRAAPIGLLEGSETVPVAQREHIFKTSLGGRAYREARYSASVWTIRYWTWSSLSSSV